MSGERIHRQVRVATASSAAVEAGLAALAVPGALARVLPGLRSDSTGHVSMVLVSPDGADVSWSGRATVDLVPGGADVRFEPATPISPSLMLLARTDDDGTHVTVEAEAIGADGASLPAAWRRSLEAFARLLAADLAAGPVAEDVAVGSGARSPSGQPVAPGASTDATGPSPSDPLDLARSLLPKDPRVAVAVAVAVVAVGWWLGSRRGRR